MYAVLGTIHTGNLNCSDELQTRYMERIKRERIKFEYHAHRRTATPD